jgi:hypothetical protein
MIAIVSYLAAIAAISGRGFTAAKSSKLRFWGFVCYIVGSLLWIGYSAVAGQWALLIQNVILIGFSIVGLKNNK